MTKSVIPKADLGFPQVIAGLDFLRAHLHKPRLEVQQVQMLLTMYAYPDGIPMQDLAKEMQCDPSFISRNAKSFGPGAKGRRIIGQRINEDNPRARLVQLTADGREILEEWNSICNGTKSPPRVPPVRDARCK